MGERPKVIVYNHPESDTEITEFKKGISQKGENVISKDEVKTKGVKKAADDQKVIQ